MVLDNAEVLLQAGCLDAGFRAVHEGYHYLLRRIAESQHQSCLLLTSREVPSVLLQTGLRVFELGGLPVSDARRLLNDSVLTGDAAAWTELTRRYAGNPLALRFVGDAIREVFRGDIAEFLEQVPGEAAFGGVRRLLESQLERLSVAEWELVRVLALAGKPVSFTTLASEQNRRLGSSGLLEAIEMLRYRSLIDRAGESCFTLQSMVMDYVRGQVAVTRAAAA
jgi:hypothetical protein